MTTAFAPAAVTAVLRARLVAYLTASGVSSSIGGVGVSTLPPDRIALGNQEKNALNVYLVDVRENRKLRSNEREREYDNGGHVVGERPAPARADCHYLITAWSSASEDNTDPDLATHGGTSEEHAILHEVASLLEANQPLVPADVWAGSFPAGFSSDTVRLKVPSRGDSAHTVVVPSG